MEQIFLIFITIINLVSLNSNDTTASISGIITNNTVEYVTLDEQTVPVTEDGVFRFEAPISTAQTFMLLVSDQPIRVHVEPGDNVQLSFDEQNLYRTLTFKGDSAPINRYLLMEDGINYELAPVFKIGQEEWVALFQLDENAFLDQLDNYTQRYFEALELAGVDDQQFLFDTRTSIRLSFDWLILQYPLFHQRYTGIPTELSGQTLAYLEEIDLDDPDLLYIDGYTTFTRDWLHFRIRQAFLENAEELNTSDNQWLLASIEVASDIFQNPETRAYWLFFYITDHIERNGVKNLKPFIDMFNSIEGNQELKEDLNALYQSENALRAGHSIMTYKTVNDFDLDAHIFMPEDLSPGETRPALIIFHGGSWNEGKPDWQFGPSPYGFIKICIEYRTYDRYRALPMDAVSDAKSAIRWVRLHADELHVDVNQIIASGNSAGGHLALCTAMVDDLDEPREELSISSRPNALILTSAVYDLNDDVWFAGMLESSELIDIITPLTQIQQDLPPMLIFHGTEDVESSPFHACEQFVQEMRQVGNTIYFYPIQDKGHFLWQYSEYWQVVGPAQTEFIQMLGYLSSSLE